MLYFVSEAAKKMGVRMNVDKTKIMNNDEESVLIGGEDLESVAKLYT